MSTGISLAVLARNEENWLANCIKSALPVVDEVVVLDTGSEDRTIEIAKENGARVFEHPWKDDFAEARNELISHCSGRWIFMLDADEELINPEIPWWKHEANLEKADAWWCIIENDQSTDKNSKSYRHRLPRLFRNRDDIRFKFPVHENLTLDDLHTDNAPCRIKHHGYNADQFDQQEKRERNLKLLSKRHDSYPQDPFTHYYFAQHYVKSGEADQAFESAVKALDLGVDGSAKLMCLRICWRYIIRCKRPDKLDVVLALTPSYEYFPEQWVFEAQILRFTEPQQSREYLGLFFKVVEQLRSKDVLYRTDTILPETHCEALQLHLLLEIETIAQPETDHILETIKKLGGLDASFLLSLMKAAIGANNQPVVSVILTYLSHSGQVDPAEVNALLQRLQNYRTPSTKSN